MNQIPMKVLVEALEALAVAYPALIAAPGPQPWSQVLTAHANLKVYMERLEPVEVTL